MSGLYGRMWILLICNVVVKLSVSLLIRPAGARRSRVTRYGGLISRMTMNPVIMSV